MRPTVQTHPQPVSTTSRWSLPPSSGIAANRSEPFHRPSSRRLSGRWTCGAVDWAVCEWQARDFPDDMEETTCDTQLSLCRCLVLDLTWRPVSVLSWRRAVCLDLLQKTEVLEDYDLCVRSVSFRHPIPAVVRANAVLRPDPDAQVPLNRSTVLLRDEGKCVYCGSRSALTVDHVVPLSKGGSKTWDNVVAACSKCNSKKGDRTLKQMGWKLRATPKQPSVFDAKFLPVRRRSGKTPKQWANYLPDIGECKA